MRYRNVLGVFVPLCEKKPYSRMMKNGKWRGVVLVGLQVVVCVLLIWLGGRGVWETRWLWIGVIAGGIISASGVWAMRVSKVKLTPEPGAEAPLCDRGIYAHIRHPMYSGLLIAFAMFAIGTHGMTGWILWLGLGVILWLKLRIEETLWSAHDPAYRDYMRRTKRLVPGVW